MSGCENAGYSHKNGRVYCRLLNYAEVRERHAAGKSINALAQEYGVAWGTIARIVDPAFAAKLEASARANQEKNHRFPCKGGCGRRVWIVGQYGRDRRSGYCQKCFGKLRRAEHGLGAYKRGCRCDMCRGAMADLKRRWRAARTPEQVEADRQADRERHRRARRTA